MGLFVLLGALCISPCAFALYSSGDAVVELNEANFDKLVTNSDGVAIVSTNPASGWVKQSRLSRMSRPGVPVRVRAGEGRDERKEEQGEWEQAS